MTAFVVLLFGWCLLLTWLYFLWSRRCFYKVAWELPGPVGLPFVGMALNMMNPETFLQFFERTSKKYKSPFISWLGTNCFLYVNDPETMESIFNSPHCTNKGALYRFMASAIGDGLFTSSSPRWNHHRRLISPAFSRQVIDDFLPIFNAEAEVLLGKFAVEGAVSKLEIYSMLKKSVLEAACRTTMGKKMSFHNDGSSAIFDAYNGLTEVCVRRMLSPWLYPDFLYRLSSLYRRQRNVTDVLFAFVDNLLQRANKAQKTDDDGNATLVQTNDLSVERGAAALKGKEFADGGDSQMRKSKAIFVEQVRKHVNRGQLSWEDVRDEANVTIAATFETTSTALYLVCLCLAMHPEYQDKLHEELVQLIPEGTQDPVSNELLERMTYTEMVINEAMRLFAPVPVVLRSACAEVCLRNGTVVPRGTQIGIDIFNMQRSERVWGPTALHFDPEHFAEAAMRQRHSFAFVPFTRGLRMCLGQRYALTLMKVFVARIFRHFRLRTEARIDDLIIKGTVSLKLKEYPMCAVMKR